MRCVGEGVWVEDGCGLMREDVGGVMGGVKERRGEKGNEGGIVKGIKEERGSKEERIKVKENTGQQYSGTEPKG